MQSHRVLYLDPVRQEVKSLMESLVPAGLELICGAELDEQDRKIHLAEASFLLVATQSVTKEMIATAKKLQLIQKTGIGVDNIDLQAAKHAGIPVANTPGGNASGVAELTILFILALYRKLIDLHRETTRGNWLMWEMRTQSYEMNGKTHGLIGFGSIAREVAKRSKAFGTNIVYYDPIRLDPQQEAEFGVAYHSLEELLSVSDIVSLHVPLLPETRHLIGRSQLALMKQNAVLINVARGHIVDEQALFEALQTNKLAGAAIDVWAEEPVRPDNPLLGLGNVIATPHIGAGTRDTMQNVLQIAFRNIQRMIDGEQPQFVVNR